MQTFVDFITALEISQLAYPQPSLSISDGQSDISFANTYLPATAPTNSLTVHSNKIGLVYGDDASLLRMLNIATFVGLKSQVLVIDGGNRFDLHYVAYSIRRITPNWEQVADRTLIVRAFTCYEVLKALQEVKPEPYPLLVIDLLATFFDESVKDAECIHLARNCVRQLARIRKSRPIVISLSPTPQEFEKRNVLSKIFEAASDLVYFDQPTVNPIRQPSLF